MGACMSRNTGTPVSAVHAMDGRLVASVVAAGIMSFSGVVVETAMNVTFPTLMGEFGVDTATVQWITTGYLLVLSLIIPLSSHLKRRFPLKTLFVGAACAFLTGTLMAALSPSFAVLLAGRLVQGIGTGIALPLMFNIILEQVPKQNLGTMMGVGNLITAVAPAVGPSFGGFLVSSVSWRAVFWVLVPVIVIALVMGAVCIRQSSELEKARFDGKGMALIAVGFAAFIFAGSNASSAGWLAPQVLGLFGLTIVCISVFCIHSLHAEAPLLRVRVFGNPVFALSVACIVLTQLTTLGLGFLIPNMAQLSLKADAFTAGCLLVPGCVLGAVLSPIGGKILDRAGAKPPIVFGNLCILAAAVLFAAFGTHLTLSLIVAFYLLYTLGQGVYFGNTMTNGLAHLSPELAADGNAVTNTLQQLAGAVGTTFVSTIVATAQAGASDLATATAIGTASAFMLTAAFCIASTICVGIIFFALNNGEPR